MPLSAVDAAASPKKIYAIHTDHLHRPVLMTDSAKASVWQATYEPYGRLFSVTGPATQNLGLPGQWFQLETGLNDNWHRHYDPSLGRFLSPDPLGFVDGPAVYAYAGGVPHLVTDDNGLWWWFARPITGGIFGTVFDAGYQYYNFGCVDWSTAILRGGAIGAGLGYRPGTGVRIGYDAKPHRFGTNWGPLQGNRPHIQIDTWVRGVKGSNSNLRVPAGPRTSWGSNRP